MSTFMAKPHQVEQKWYVIDAEGKTLGRVASEAASILRGKKKPIYTPHVDTGDFVIVILTGHKLDDKMYRHHSGYLGGLKEMTYRELFAKKPTMPIYLAVKGMLPKSSLGRKMLTKLKVYAGSEHNHQAQKPELWQF